MKYVNISSGGERVDVVCVSVSVSVAVGQITLDDLRENLANEGLLRRHGTVFGGADRV